MVCWSKFCWSKIEDKKILGKKISKKIGKVISKITSGKYSQKHLDHTKQLKTNCIKTTSKKVIQKTAEVTDDFIGKKIAYKNAKVSRSSPQNISRIVAIEKENAGLNRQIPKEIYLYKYKYKYIYIYKYKYIYI